MKERITFWQIGMLILSVYVLAALFVDSVAELPSEVSRLIWKIDNIICAIFFADFVRNLVKSESRIEYLKWGWLDLLSSVPNIQAFRVARLARVIRILRIIRGFRATKTLLKELYKQKAKGTLSTAVITSILLMIFSSIAVLNVETAGSSNIRTAEEAIWWTFVSITTVGYGDYYPVTTLGRVLGAMLMIAGIGLFGVFTAYIAGLFVEGKENELLREIREIRDNLAKQTEKK